MQVIAQNRPTINAAILSSWTWIPTKEQLMAFFANLKKGFTAYLQDAFIEVYCKCKHKMAADQDPVDKTKEMRQLVKIALV